MRFSAALALCAAPLALAGTLQAELMKRGVAGIEVAQSETIEGGNSNSKSNSNSNSKSNNNNNGNNVVVQNTQVTEVIIIWVNNGGNSATSTLNTVASTGSAAGSTAAGAAVAAIQTHQVTVGGSAGLIYSPETIEAAVGDMVVFTFMSQNHTVTQSAFTTPCDPLAGGQDSQFMANINNTVSPPPQMAMQVTVATPLWFYCKQSGHCGKGMTFSINPTVNKTQAMFKQMAIAQKGTGTTSPIAGGSAAAAPVASASSSVAAAAAAPAATSSTSSSTSSNTGSTGLVPGNGNTASGGTCSCSCLCGVGSFPDISSQGLNAFGGMAGSMPASQIEA